MILKGIVGKSTLNPHFKVSSQMLFFPVVSTILLLFGLGWEINNYMKSPHSIWQVMIHLTIDCAVFGFLIASNWALYYNTLPAQ